jgi:hypothetical protein
VLDDVSLFVFIELLLLALFELSVNVDDLVLASDTDFVELLAVANVSDAFFVLASVAVRDLFEERFKLAFSVLDAVNEFVSVPAELLVVSAAVAPLDADGPLVVVPTPLEVLPPLAEALLYVEAAVSEAVPPKGAVARAAVAPAADVELSVVAMFPVLAKVAAAVLAEVAVRPKLFVDANVAALFLLEFLDEEALNVLDEDLLALSD